jgi:hypothetical protein
MSDLAASMFRLSAFDVANGNGTATVTLRSGAAFEGEVDKHLSTGDLLHLKTPKGWHAIDYCEIAAITGERT